MNSLEIIRSLKAKAAADLAADQALTDLICAKRDSLALPFQTVIEELGHLVQQKTDRHDPPKTLAARLGVDFSCHNHRAHFSIKDGYQDILGGAIEGDPSRVAYHTWHRDSGDRNNTRSATSEQALDHLLHYIAAHYEEPAA